MPNDNTTISAPVQEPVNTSVDTTQSDVAIPDVPAVDSSATSVSDNPAMPVGMTQPVEAAVADESIQQDTESKVAHAIAESQNVLIALSSDPSVDEMAAAIGMSLFLDRLGKRATAIYSGSTPNALEFLKPEETFEPSADTLQDFVVALNKDKADHVRCKVDGDYVKMYITPYRTKVSEEDLEFSYGDYNVDLVLALDVANGIDLDSALREHGRIMHDASIVNITTGNPGKFGEIEWSDKTASSVSEMLARLVTSVNSKEQLSPEESTAFLTGIVAATDRFSNAGTTSETMKIASKLMELGANQQLISQNITNDVENEMFNMTPMKVQDVKRDKDELAKIDIEHSEDEESEKVSDGAKNEVAGAPVGNLADEVRKEPATEESGLLDDLQKAAMNLAQAGNETVPEPGATALEINNGAVQDNMLNKFNMEQNEVSGQGADLQKGDELSVPENENVIPTVKTGSESFGGADTQPNYGQMMENALSDAGVAPANEPTQAIVSESDNPAAANAPQVPSSPEINGVPEINYAPEAPILPPPPAPPVMNELAMPGGSMPPVQQSDMDASSVGEESKKVQPLGEQPVMQDQVYGSQATDPGAFQIPGM